MKHPIIHIGYPKTATTWFQRKFYPSIKNIEFINRQVISDVIINPRGFLFNKQKATDALSNSSSRLIICEEMLIGSNHSGGNHDLFTKEIAQRLKSTFEEAQIILFVRNQADMIASSYCQYIKQGGTYSINNYLFPKKDSILHDRINYFSFDFFKYENAIRYYQQLFGKENAHIYVYEDFTSNHKAFLNSFCQNHNFDIDLNKLDFSKENERYGTLSLKLLRFLNIFTKKNVLNKYYLINIPHWHVFSRRVINQLNRLRIFRSSPSSIKILGEKNFQYIQEYYKTSNQTLIEEFDLNQIKKHNYPL